MVEFNTLQDYVNLVEVDISDDPDIIDVDDIIDLLINSSNYTSYGEFLFDDVALASMGTEEFLDATYDKESFIYTLINQDRLVKIDNYFLKFNFADELVLVMDENSGFTYDDVINAHSGNTGVYSYTFDQNVVAALEYHQEHAVFPDETMDVALGCDGASSGKVQSITEAGTMPFGSYTYQVYMGHKVSYSKFGIYFETASGTAAYTQTNGVNHLSINEYSYCVDLEYNKNCKSNHGPYSLSGVKDNSGWSIIRWYKSTKKIKKNSLHNESRGKTNGVYSSYLTIDR